LNREWKNSKAEWSFLQREWIGEKGARDIANERRFINQFDVQSFGRSEVPLIDSTKFLARRLWVFGSMSSSYADEHSKMACAVHSLSTTMVCTPLPRWASFIAAPKKEGKKRAFLSGTYGLTAFGRGTFNHRRNVLFVPLSKTAKYYDSKGASCFGAIRCRGPMVFYMKNIGV